MMLLVRTGTNYSFFCLKTKHPPTTPNILCCIEMAQLYNWISSGSQSTKSFQLHNLMLSWHHERLYFIVLQPRMITVDLIENLSSRQKSLMYKHNNTKYSTSTIQPSKSLTMTLGKWLSHIRVIKNWIWLIYFW